MKYLKLVKDHILWIDQRSTWPLINRKRLNKSSLLVTLFYIVQKTRLRLMIKKGFQLRFDYMNKDEMERLSPCLIHIDKEGRWFHKGSEMIHRDFIRLFYENMGLTPEGVYVIHWNGKTCYVDVEDTAHVIRRIVHRPEKEGGGECYMLYLSDDLKEELAPETLSVGKENVLYCRVKDSVFPARFTRAAYYQIAGFITERQGLFYLPLNDRLYPIAMHDDSE